VGVFFLKHGAYTMKPLHLQSIVEISMWVCRKWVDAHMQKYARLRCFHLSAWIDLSQTFNKYRGASRLHNKIFQLRRLVKGHCYGNWFLACLRKLTHPVVILCACVQRNGCKNRNMDCCINTASDPSTALTNLVNFGQ